MCAQTLVTITDLILVSKSSSISYSNITDHIAFVFPSAYSFVGKTSFPHLKINTVHDVMHGWMQKVLCVFLCGSGSLSAGRKVCEWVDA